MQISHFLLSDDSTREESGDEGMQSYHERRAVKREDWHTAEYLRNDSVPVLSPTLDWETIKTQYVRKREISDAVLDLQ